MILFRNCVVVKEEERECLFQVETLGAFITAIIPEGFSVYCNGIYTVEAEKEGTKYLIHSLQPDLDAVCKELLAAGISLDVAEKIVKTLGCETISVIEEDPKRLETIPGIGGRRSCTIIKAMAAYRSGKQMALAADLIRDYRLSKKDVRLLCDQFPDLREVKENPYLLCKLPGIRFAYVDKAAQVKEYDPYNLHRLTAAAEIVIEEYCVSTGDMSMAPGTFLRDFYNFLGGDLEIKALQKSINKLVSMRRLYFEYGRIYDGWHYDVETEAARLLKALITRKLSYPDPDEECIRRLEEKYGITLDDVQKGAVLQAVTSPVTLITGGPGTGKSTIVPFIIELCQGKNAAMEVALLAPTGRAAQNMAEKSGYPASTIHSALQLPPGKKMLDVRQLTADLVIVDEISMVGLSLAVNLLAAIPPKARLILLGDPNQLPSIEEGAFAREMVALGMRGSLSYTRLECLYRQKQTSSIPALANAINGGDAKKLGKLLEGDISYQHVDHGKLKESILSCIQKCLREGYTLPQVIVLCPLRNNGPVCTASINDYLQNQLLPPSKEKIIYKGKEFRLSSRVIQEKNTQMAANGELGTVVAIEDNAVTVRFDTGKMVTFEGKEMANLNLAYAITVHKSQGSQYPVVILPLHPSYLKMAKRDLYYTAVTRAKKLIVLGDLSVLRHAAVSVSLPRTSYFAYRVTQSLKKDIPETKKEDKGTGTTVKGQLSIFDYMDKAG